MFRFKIKAQDRQLARLVLNSLLGSHSV
jgi:hypothetical protein